MGCTSGIPFLSWPEEGFEHDLEEFIFSLILVLSIYLHMVESQKSNAC